MYNEHEFAGFARFKHFVELKTFTVVRVQDLYVHQTETGRPVTDTVVQEVCKLRPDMIGLSLRDCVEVNSRLVV